MFDPKDYKYSTAFRGDAAEAFAVARTALLSLGFEILVDTKSEIKAEGPGMHSNQQPELLGVSALQLMISPSEITANAKLGGVATMKTFVYLFPPGLILSLMIINGLFGEEMPWLYGLIALPWLFITPFIGNSLESKTTRAVDRLVRGMAQAKSR